MNYMNLESIEFFDEDSFFVEEPKNKTKVKKRQWREIESIKEKRRLKKQLESLEQYSF